MKINTEQIILLRQDKAWSQEELALAAGLNLRTVQRIEREGVISLQSKKALSAAFDVAFETLDYEEPNEFVQYEYKTVVFKSDVSWISGWGKKTADTGPFKLDEQINLYGLEGWKVHTITHGSSVHGGAGQVMVVFERQMNNVK